MSRPTRHRVCPARPTETERRERTLRLAYVNVPSALGCRPAPRSAFDKPASDELRRPWRGFAEPLRRCAEMAASRPESVRRQTEALIVGAVAALLDYVLEPLNRPAADVTYLALATEQAEAIEAQAVARLVPTPEHRARAVEETTDVIALAQLYCHGETERARGFMRPLGASPRGAA